jgi:branched-chain amino acid transport system ATP-binding protein
MPFLDVRNVSVSFGGLKALSDVTFSVEQGEIFSIIGPNGAGKTTLFNVVSGMSASDTGEVYLTGERLNGLPPSQRARLGIQRTFQNLQILGSMTALENVMVGSHLHQRTGFLAALFGLPGVSVETETAAEHGRLLLERLGLAGVRDQQASTLPYGLQKRLEIARALAARPQILLLDEPAAGLNANETSEIGDVIRKLAEEGITIVLVEHDMRLVMGISNRIFVLNFGRALACGTAEEVSSDPEVVRAYLGVEMDREVTSAPHGR